ncbi:hypothetical protein ACLB2K_062365 [Fragaria x ananassa]
MAKMVTSARENLTCDSRITCPVRPASHNDTCFFFPQLFFFLVAVFSLFSGETAHRRLHHTGSPSPRERGRKKKRREEEEEAERKGEEERKEEEEEEGRERKEEEEAEKQRRKEGRRRERKEEEEEAEL